MFRIVAVVLTLAVAVVLAESQHANPVQVPATSLRVPDSLVTEHRELHEQLLLAVRAKGKTGAAAEDVEAALMPHFKREEEFAMPPLGLLEPLAKRKSISGADKRAVIKMVDRLRAEYPRMLKEHEQVVALLGKLRTAALSEHKLAQIEFVEKLKLHARNEEQILYPAALIVGERLKKLR